MFVVPVLSITSVELNQVHATTPPEKFTVMPLPPQFTASEFSSIEKL